MVLRSVVAAIVGFLFFTLLTSLIGVAVFSQITERESLKPMLSNIILGQIKLSDQDLSALYANLELQCKDKLSAMQNLGSVNVSIKCSDLSSLKSKDLPNYIASQAFDTLYDRSLDCEVLQCLQQGKLDVLVSSAGNAFAKSFLTSSFIATLLLGALFGFLLNNLVKFVKGIGSTLFGTGILLYASTFLTPALPAQFAMFAPLLEKASALIANYSLVAIAVGFVLLVAGFLLEKRKV